MLAWIRNHSISLPLFVFCVLCLIAQSITGYLTYNQQQQEHTQPLISYPAYLGSDDYWETVAENAEGEFIAIAAYVLLTTFFVEKGAKGSRKPGQRDIPDVLQESKEEQDQRMGKHVPWGERQKGVLRWLYQHSLFLAFFILFLGAFCLHSIKGLQANNKILREQHQPLLSFLDYVGSSLFWLQSMRNWQAGFLSTGLLAALSIFLRQRGSPVSKKLEQPDEETGEPEEE